MQAASGAAGRANVGLSSASSSYTCAAGDKISTDVARRAVRLRHQGFLFAMRSLILAAAGLSSGWRVISDVKRVDKESSRSSSYHLCAGRQRTKLCDEIQCICHVLERH